MDNLGQLKDKIEYIKDQTDYQINLLLARKDKIDILLDYDGDFDIEFYLNGDVCESKVSFMRRDFQNIDVYFIKDNDDDYEIIGQIDVNSNELSINRNKTFYEMIKKLNETIDDKLNKKIKKCLRD